VRLVAVLCVSLLFCNSCKKENKAGLAGALEISVSKTSTEATLSWATPEGCESSSLYYKVYLGDSLVAGSVEVPFFKLSSLSETTTYVGRVEAYSNGTINCSGNFTFITPANALPNIFKLVITDIGNRSVRLVWEKATDPENDVVTYAVYVGNTLQPSDADTNCCEISGLTPLTTYNCRIVATNRHGKSRNLPVQFKTIEPEGSRMIHTGLKVGSYNREFSIYLPHTIAYLHPRPLVIFLHGANGNAWLQMQTSYFRTLADRDDFLFAMPQALLGTYNGESIYQWDAHYLFPWDDVAFLNRLIDYMAETYEVDLSRVYLSGMSNGGFMTFFAAREMQDRLAAIAPIAGLMSANVFYQYTLSHPLPLCYMHGTADSIVSMNASPSLNDVLNLWMQINGCNPATIEEELPDNDKTDNQTVSLFRYSGTGANSEIWYYRINGGGHCIPGIESGSTGDINAFEEIWNFFRRFRNEHGK